MSKKRGFLTIELLISIAIMTVLTTVTLSANTSMSSRIEVENLAHLVALEIREAQVKSISAEAEYVGESAFLAPGFYFRSHGVHFSNKKIGQDTQFITFIDAHDGTGTSLVPGTYVALEDYIEDQYLGDPYIQNLITHFSLSQGAHVKKIGNGLRISNLCAITSTSGNVCENIIGGAIDITFKRPKSNARILVNGVPVREAQINITSPRGGYTKTVVVTATGQISVR